MGRDIRNYYRNFLLSPYSWWKTYAYALGGYWFNPYMPFGGSSCTSLAQRQSDAIRVVAKVAHIEAELLPMLDDFLIVVPRKVGETAEENLKRANTQGGKFDDLLEELHLPKASEKDQEAAFTTIWYGIKFNSNQRSYSVPRKKWNEIGQFFVKKFLADDGITIRDSVDAADLLSGLGKMHHVVLVWPAGRPCLYFLWRLYYTATFSPMNPSKLQPRKQSLEVSPEAKSALEFWRIRLSETGPPERRMLCCSTRPNALTIDILKVKSSPKTRNTVLVRLPSCEWWRPQELLDDDYKRMQGDSPIESIGVWLEVLQDSIETLDIRSATEVIIVRTNVWKLDEAIRKDLYVRSTIGVQIANTIHQLLRGSGQLGKMKQNYQVELASVLIRGGTPHPLN